MNLSNEFRLPVHTWLILLLALQLIIVKKQIDVVATYKFVWNTAIHKSILTVDNPVILANFYRKTFLKKNFVFCDDLSVAITL